jgi:hypothetical protein
VPERHVLEPHECSGADDTREAADPLGDDRVPLVRHRRRALLTLAERLLHLGHFRPGQVPNLERESLQRGRGQRERREQRGVPVALHDLRRGRLRLEPEPLARDPLDLGVDCRVVPDRARELPDLHGGEGARNPFAVALELERPDGQLEPERRRLRMHAVSAADRQREPVLHGAPGNRCERALDAIEDQLAGRADLERERRVDDVRRRQPVMEPAPGRPELTRDGVDERNHVVVRLPLDLRDALRCRSDRVQADFLSGLRGYDPNLRPAVERRELDLEPALELALVRPDTGHLRSRVA